MAVSNISSKLDKWDKMVELVIECTPLLRDFAIIIMEYCKEIKMKLDEYCPHDGHFPGDVCGFGFFAPCNFVITSLKVDDSYLKGPQSVQVIRFNVDDICIKTKSFPSYIDSEWISLFHAAECNQDIIDCHIEINKDDVIGIIGHRDNHCTPNGVNAGYKTNIFDDEIILCRVTTSPNHVSIPHTKQKNCSIGEGASSSIGRIEMWYC